MGSNADPPSTNWPPLNGDGAPDASYGYEAMTGTAIAKIDGWTPSVHELETPATDADPAMTDTLVIYSNTDFEIAVNFADEHMLNTNPDGNNNNQSLTIYSGNLSQVSDVSAFPSASDLAIANVAENVIGVAQGYGGKFDGAAGEYWCASAGGCNFSTDAAGNLSSLLSGTLYFTPAAGAEVDVPNPDYMYFGYWQKVSEDSNNEPVFEIAGLSGGPGKSPHSEVAKLIGSATYEGSATGLYVRQWTATNTDVLRRRTGQFTADVALSARFRDLDPNDAFKISGTMSSFMAGDRAIDPNWRLSLERADIANDGGGFTSFSGYTQDVDGDGDPISGAAAMGAWSGYLFGEAEEDNDLNTPGIQPTYPSGVAGTFDGHFNNGDVIGAYGAERQ